MSSEDRAASTIKRVSDLLDAEFEQSKISPLQRFWFGLLQFFAYLLPPLIAALLVVDRRPAELGFASPFLQTAVTVCAGLVVVLILPNLPLIFKAIRQVRLSRKLSALRLAEHLWVPGGRVIRGRGRALLILSTPVALLALFVINVARRDATDTPEATALEVALVLFVCVGLPLILYGFDRLLERVRGRLNYAHEVVAVRRALGRATSGGPDSTGITRALELRMADIERLHILRQRARALDFDESSGGGGLLTSKRAQVVAALKQLPLETRLPVEDAIEDLSDEPVPAGAADAGDGLWLLSVTDTGIRILYSVDRDAGRIEIVSIESTGEEATPR